MREWSSQQNDIFDWFEGTDYVGKDYNRGYRPLNLIVRARAGTGKTTVIIEGVKRAPEKAVLICAFSKIIQEELKNRIGINYDGIKAQTLHSVGFQCVRRFRDRISVEFGDSRANKLADQVCGPGAPDAIKRLVAKLHTKGREIIPHAKDPGDLINLAINFECEPDMEWEGTYPVEYIEAKALEAMELAANIKSGETIDGSDMIFLPVRNHWLTGMYDLVVVDEAQDMTTTQLEIAQGVLRKGGRIAIVGDDRQAIFGFRGADSESLDRLKIELNAGELGLTTTYRCGKAIVMKAQQLVEDFQAGPNNPEGEIIYLNTSKLTQEAGPGDFILSRVNAPLVSIAMNLLRSGKRTRIAGKDIGKGLIALVRKFRASSVPDFIRKVEMWKNREISRQVVKLEKATNGRTAAIESKIEGINDQAEMLTSFAEEAKNINEINSRIESLFSDDGRGVEGMITCSSVHKAKGLEADRIFVLQDTIRSHSKEERNIEYVAITRAKKSLILVSDKYNIEEVK